MILNRGSRWRALLFARVWREIYYIEQIVGRKPHLATGNFTGILKATTRRKRDAVLRGQVGLGHEQVYLGRFYQVISGLDKPSRLGLVAGAQTCLLSCRAVFAVEDVSASEQCEPLLHSCLSSYGHELKAVEQQWWRSVG